MDKLCKYIDRELEELENKAGRGKLSAGELEYADKLAHLKKSLLTNEAMEGEYSNEYRDSYRGSYNRGGSYARGSRARRDSMGRYSSEEGYSRDDFMDQVEDLMDSAPDEHTRKKLEHFLKEMR